MQAWDEKKYPPRISFLLAHHLLRQNSREIVSMSWCCQRTQNWETYYDDGGSSPGKFLGNKRIYRRNNSNEKIEFFCLTKLKSSRRLRFSKENQEVTISLVIHNYSSLRKTQLRLHQQSVQTTWIIYSCVLPEYSRKTRIAADTPRN